MSISDRIYKDENGKMMMPMNLESGNWNEHFITSSKLVVIICVGISLIGILIYLGDAQASFKAWLVYLFIWAFISQLLLRYIVFEEKMYYSMYQELKKFETTTPAIFWDIVSIKDTGAGAMLTYSDAKFGIVVKLDRDTITGKSIDFKETHYDSFSNFYKELMRYKYKFVQMNIMETAGKDSRLDGLENLIVKCDNPNMKRLMKSQIGYVKNITHKTLFESDYILVYTSDLNKMDSIFDDVEDCLCSILDGAFNGYKVLKAYDIVEFVKEQYGVKLFSYNQATLSLMKDAIADGFKVTSICGIGYTDGQYQELSSTNKNKVSNMTSDILSGAVSIENIALKDTLFEKKNKREFGIILDDSEAVQPKKESKDLLDFDIDEIKTVSSFGDTKDCLIGEHCDTESIKKENFVGATEESSIKSVDFGDTPIDY